MCKRFSASCDLDVELKYDALFPVGHKSVVFGSREKMGYSSF